MEIANVIQHFSKIVQLLTSTKDAQNVIFWRKLIFYLQYSIYNYNKYCNSFN